MKILRQMGELIIMCTVTALLLSLTFLGPVLCILTENPLKVMYYRGRAWRLRLIEWWKQMREKRRKEALDMANTGRTRHSSGAKSAAIATELEKEGIVSKDPEPFAFCVRTTLTCLWQSRGCSWRHGGAHEDRTVATLQPIGARRFGHCARGFQVWHR